MSMPMRIQTNTNGENNQENKKNLPIVGNTKSKTKVMDN